MARKYTRRAAVLAMNADAIAEAEEANTAMARGFGDKPVPSEEPPHPADRKNGPVMNSTMKAQFSDSLKLLDEREGLYRVVAAYFKCDPEEIISVVVTRHITTEY